MYYFTFEVAVVHSKDRMALVEATTHTHIHNIYTHTGHSSQWNGSAPVRFAAAIFMARKVIEHPNSYAINVIEMIWGRLDWGDREKRFALYFYSILRHLK